MPTNLGDNMNNDVLFQKIGNVWFLVTEVNGEVLFTILDKDPHLTKIDLITID